MISVEEALNIILGQAEAISVETCPSVEATGRVLQEEIQADRDFPPYDRVMMDGIALRYADWEAGHKRFLIQGTLLAGSPPLNLEGSGGAIEIMTGAMCPPGADTVIPVEDIRREEVDGQVFVHLEVDTLKKGQHIHQQGTDRKAGEVLLKPGALISQAEVAVAVSVGKPQLQVSRLPNIALISTGDELVDITDTPLPHQIRRSNVYALSSVLKQYQIEPTLYHLQDSLPEVEKRLAQILEEFDIILLSGGVSKGKADYIPQALENLGADKLFHRVKQKPGKPFWFGRRKESVLFSFPGNPVSTVVCFYRYLIPYIQQISGASLTSLLQARLGADFSFKAPLTYFLSVKIHFSEEGALWAYPIPGQGSGDFANLIACDGFLELPPDRSDFTKGEVFPYIPFRNLVG